MSLHPDIEFFLHAAPVIPVVIIDNLADAVPLARALLAGGLCVIEVTLRTAAGIEAIRAIAAELPEAIIGAGTVLEPAQLTAIAAAGARFAVSPGATPKILDAAADQNISLLPGIATCSEAMALIERGYRFAKFFPAEPAGGAAYLSAI
jgi:2-dehydro-3-deoxyphosphogluconate aldolase/(4S)-4-hydroxy-2-oxoglutarate aldolase